LIFSSSKLARSFYHTSGKEIIMKQIFAGLAIVTAMAACNNNNTNKEAEIQQAKQYAIDSMKNAAALEEAERKAEAATAAASRRSSSSSRNTATYRSYSEPANLPTTSDRDAHDRPGWSNKAKGAVVGGVVGAVTGAAVSKDKKAKGAVIGGVIGAAGGYGVGAILDNKKKKQ
jgi:hypothetical protein